MLVRSPEEFRKRQGIEVFLKHRAVRIDPARREAEFEDLQGGQTKRVAYDQLVLATGARSRRPGLPGENASNFFTLKDLHDGIRIRDFLDRKRPARAVILGSGYIGLEMAEAFRRRGMEVVILYRGSRPASRMEPEISSEILKELARNQVAFLPNHELQGFRIGSQGEIVEVSTNQGAYGADLVLAALGVVPNTEIAREAGVALGPTGAIRTDAGQRTNLDDVFAAGDCCETYHQILEDFVYLPLGDLANKQGRVAGLNAAGGSASFPGIVGSQCFQVFSLEVASTGISEQTASQRGWQIATQTIEGSSKVPYMPGASPLLLKLVFDRSTGRILGAHMAGKEGVARRINTLALAVQARLTVQDLARMDFAYAPPFSPPLDPILVAAEQAQKKISG